MGVTSHAEVDAVSPQGRPTVELEGPEGPWSYQARRTMQWVSARILESDSWVRTLTSPLNSREPLG